MPFCAYMCRSACTDMDSGFVRMPHGRAFTVAQGDTHTQSIVIDNT